MRVQRILAWAAVPFLFAGTAVGFGLSEAATPSPTNIGSFNQPAGTSLTDVCQSGTQSYASYYGVAGVITCTASSTTTTTTSPPTTTTTVPPTTTTVPPTTTTVPPTTTTTTQPVNTGLSLGSYNGNSNVQGALDFANQTGTTATNYDDYLDGSSFQSMCSGSDTPLPNIKGNLGNMRLILSVPLAGASYGVNGAQTLANYAASPGAWNQCFKTLGQELVNDGFSNAIIRLMWEPDSGIYSSGDITSAQNFATLWRDAWTNAMSVSGAHFQWAWYWGGNFDNNTNNAAWPGSQYVDYVTYDQYDQSWTGNCGLAYDGSNWNSTQSNCVWNNDILQHLNNMAAFAQGQGKPIGIGEWGVINRGDGHGGGDDPTFVNNITAWFKANNVQWISYFNFNSGGNSILSNYPNSLNAYKADL